jgi:AAA domain
VRLSRLVMHGFRSYREPVEVRFEPGVNVFLGRNEAGKTGILLAVQAALYAPRTAAERESLVAEGSDICQVAVEYSLPDGREFRVARDLVAHKGSIAECREGSWLTLATSVGDIAQIVREHTGCDDALFRATLLVRHEGVEVGDADDLTRSLSERIELLVSGSPGGISAARAVKKLEDGVKVLSGPRAGLVTAAEGRLREAQSALSSAISAARRLAEGKPRLEELNERSEQLETELADAEAVLERARRVAGLEARKAELQSGRGAIDRALDARAELALLEKEAADARGRVPAPLIAASPLPALPTAWRGWTYLGGLLLLGGVVAAALGQVLLGGTLAVVGIGLALANWRFSPSPRSGEGRVGRPIQAEADVEPERIAREAERKRDLAEGAARSLDQRPEAELTAERSRLGRDLEEAEARLAEAAIHRLEAADLARREIRAQQLPALIKVAAEARIRCEVELQQLESAGSSLAELEDEVEVARRDVERLKLRLDAMKLAREELEAAIQDIRLGVGPDLAAEATHTLAGVAPDYSVALAAGSGLAFVPAGPDGEPLGRRQLSDGTLDQFHFAVRVALANVLLGELRPPLLLDDPFRYADDERRAALHTMLAGIGAERQVLYFTVEEPTPLAVTHRLPKVASRVGSE